MPDHEALLNVLGRAVGMPADKHSPGEIFAEVESLFRYMREQRDVGSERGKWVWGLFTALISSMAGACAEYLMGNRGQ